MTQPQPVLVIGGTRGTGRLIAQLLHRRGTRVRVLARDRRRALTLFEPALDIVEGDITMPETLQPAIDGSRHIIFTAGCRSGHPVSERRIKETEYQGVLNTLVACRQLGFKGRFLYMTSSGLTSSSLATRCLNLWKGNTLIWRRLAEDEIRASGLEYTVIRTGVLLNRSGGRHCIEIAQRPLPLSPRFRIARADVAEIFVAAVDHPCASRATFEAVWGRRGSPEPWNHALDRLHPDTGSPRT